MGKEKRYPRLSGERRAIARCVEILRATYNKLTKERNTYGRYKFDVFNTKKGHVAKIYFPILADRLIEARIDPSLYLKVMAKYGAFERAKYLPPPKFLAGQKGFDTFQWMLMKERRRYPKIEDWKQHLNSQASISPADIYESVRNSAEIIQDTVELMDLTIGEASLICLDRVSPWFLAICTSFHRLGGPDLLIKKHRKRVEHCMRYLMGNRGAFKEALRGYTKIARM